MITLATVMAVLRRLVVVSGSYAVAYLCGYVIVSLCGGVLMVVWYW